MNDFITETILFRLGVLPYPSFLSRFISAH
jgi:hypothetical protein